MDRNTTNTTEITDNTKNSVPYAFKKTHTITIGIQTDL